MHITNYTKVPLELLKEIIDFCRPPQPDRFDIAFKNSDQFHGRAYVKGCSYHDRSSRKKGRVGKSRTPYVVINVPKFKRYRKPNVTDHGKGYLRSVQFTFEEDIVHLVAHELRHLWQAKVPKGRRVWGARGVYSERDADAYAIARVRAWRIENGCRSMAGN